MTTLGDTVTSLKETKAQSSVATAGEQGRRPPGSRASDLKGPLCPPQVDSEGLGLTLPCLPESPAPAHGRGLSDSGSLAKR